MSDSDWLNIIADDSLPSPRTKRKSKFFGCIPPESGSTIFQAWWWDVYNPNLDFTRDSRKENQRKMDQMKVKSSPDVTKCPIFERHSKGRDQSGRSPKLSLFYGRLRPLLVKWLTSLTLDRPYRSTKPPTLVLSRPLWYQWSSKIVHSLAGWQSLQKTQRFPSFLNVENTKSSLRKFWNVWNMKIFTICNFYSGLSYLSDLLMWS